MKVKITQLCSTICDPKDYTVYGILQARILELVAFPFSRDLPNPKIDPRSPALRVDSLPAEPQGSPRILEWVAYPFSRGSSQPRNYTRVSHIAGRFFTSWATRKTGLWYPDDTFYLIFSTLQDFKWFRMTSFWNSFELKYLKFYLDYFKVSPSIHL